MLGIDLVAFVAVEYPSGDTERLGAEFDGVCGWATRLWNQSGGLVSAPALLAKMKIRPSARYGTRGG